VAGDQECVDLVADVDVVELLAAGAESTPVIIALSMSPILPAVASAFLRRSAMISSDHLFMKRRPPRDRACGCASTGLPAEARRVIMMVSSERTSESTKGW